MPVSAGHAGGRDAKTVQQILDIQTGLSTRAGDLTGSRRSQLEGGAGSDDAVAAVRANIADGTRGNIRHNLIAPLKSRNYFIYYIIPPTAKQWHTLTKR